MVKTEQNALLTVRQFSDKYPWPSESALRAIISDAAWGKNSFANAFKRIGRRVLVDEGEFWRCVESMQEGQSHAN